MKIRLLKGIMWTLSLISHNSTSKNDLDMIHCSVGQAVAIYKLNISVLGDNYIER